ncbi:MAG: peptidase S53 [Acidobacteria bacterium]|nr:MAG: peptidase S53 [Acidobacteriota bacterium]
MNDDYVAIEGSFRSAPQNATLIGEVADSERIEISIYLKEREGDPLLNTKPLKVSEASGDGRAFQTRNQMRAARTQLYADDIKLIAAFAGTTRLALEKQQPERRLVKLVGTATALEAAFRTKLYRYSDGGTPFRVRTGWIYLPAKLAAITDAVLGFDTRRAAHPKLARPIDAHTLSGRLPNQIARLYGAPSTGRMGGGQCIALIELGGGYRDSDNELAFKTMYVGRPTVIPVSVSGGQNLPGPDPDADGEVALDIQVAGSVAPGATIAVYFAPNTTQGFVDAISRAVHDAHNEPSVISIGWGSAEEGWNAQSLRAMEAALRDAARLGVTVFAASGDSFDNDRIADGFVRTDYPASSPYVVACGGSRLATDAGAISGETICHERGAGTRSGISDVFDLPPYQADAEVPASANGGYAGRGVPDVAGDADLSSGYRIIMGDVAGLIGGTSAVASLWAGLFALINEVCGQPVGMPHQLLYGNPEVCRDIVEANSKNNDACRAQNGWRVCTGLGAPDGQKLVELFRRASRNAPVELRSS